MQYIKIGVPFLLELAPEKGTSFGENVPCARLYQAQSDAYYEAVITEAETEGVFLATWDTWDMLTGTYSLEVYQDNTLEVMMKDFPKQNFATAIKVSVSNRRPQEESSSESSESESSSTSEL